MKTLVVISTLSIAILSSCATQKTGTYTDDVYANPKEDRIVEAKIKEEKRLAKAAADKRYNDSIAAIALAQKEKDDANPYYKDREFKYDDYYDYEYATRLKRFDNGINGLGYYDNYYTNSYWYSGNPYNYGVSVYNGYSWWGSSYNNYSYNPSVTFYNSWGWGYGNQFNIGYGGYNPYMAGYAAGYNNGFNNGLYGNYYGYGNPYYGGGFGYPYGGYGFGYGYGDPYGYGYGYGNPYGFGNPYYNGWGYYNAYDFNSSYTYGPRSSNGGANSRRTSNPGLTGGRESLSQKYIDGMAEKQANAVKFSDVRGTRNEPVRVGSDGQPVGTGGVKPTRNNPVRTTPDVTNEPVRNQPTRNEPVRSEPVRNNPEIGSEPVRNQPVKVEPVRQQPIDQPVRNPRNETPVRQTPIRVEPVRQPQMETPRNEPIRSMPSNGGGGGVSPSGGSGRPR